MSGRIVPDPRCGSRPVCPAELAVCLVVIVLVVVLAGPGRVATGAGGMIAAFAEMVGAIFDAGGFLRPSW
jgi:hypothetical protein